jgi:helix-turn-helix protein
MLARLIHAVIGMFHFSYQEKVVRYEVQDILHTTAGNDFRVFSYDPFHALFQVCHFSLC